MGYRAPSAEDIYRYVFRIDDRNRSLTDGFGLSIIFVNDNSFICQDFINKHFVDICHRTADRIRIIFFSDLPQSHFEKIAYQMDHGKNGLLGEIINSISYKFSVRFLNTKFYHQFIEALQLKNYFEVDLLLSDISEKYGPMYADALYQLTKQHQMDSDIDLEKQVRIIFKRLKDKDPFRRMYEDQWRELTPTSLIPIDAPERTQELSYKKRNNTVMPGIGESIKFASRLGIGRHVPCFVFFTDLGELAIDIFPVKQLSTAELYNKLRMWIDCFYEKNQINIDKWNHVEKEITSFIYSIKNPLKQLRDWIDESDEIWNELRALAQLIVTLSSSVTKPEIYKMIIDNLAPSSYEWSWECRQILSECQSTLVKFSQERERHCLRQEGLDEIINKLNTASDFDQIYDAFYFASRSNLTPSSFMEFNGPLRQAMNSMGMQRQMRNAPDPEKEIITWWKHVQANLPSLRKFKRAQYTWSFLDKENRDQNIAKAEYFLMLDDIFSLQLSDSTDTMLKKTRLLIEKIVGIDHNSTDWDSAFLEYSKELYPFFHQICDNAPIWIDKLKTPLIIADLIPFRNRDPIAFKNLLAINSKDTPLQILIKKVSIEWPTQKEKIIEKSQETALYHRKNVIFAYNQLHTDPVDVHPDEIDAFTTCLQKIRNLRDSTEKKLFKLSNSSREAAFSLKKINKKDFKRLTKLLNEYDTTVNSLIYPYKLDKSIKNIILPSEVQTLFEFTHNASFSRKISEQMRKELEETIQASTRGPNLLEKAQNHYYTKTPIELLANELVKQGVIKTDYFPSTDQLVKKLNSLNDKELYHTWSILNNSHIKAMSRKTILDMILSIIGIIPANKNNIKSNNILEVCQSKKWPKWMGEILKTSNQNSNIDIGIIIALEEEFQELAPQLKMHPYYNSEIKQYYYLFEYSNNNATYQCVVTFMGSMGPTDAGIVADRLIAQFNPALIVSIGIAGSMDEDVFVGNVVVAEQTDEYLATGKAIETEDENGWNIQFSGNPYKSDPTYVAHAMNIKYANKNEFQEWQQWGKEKLEEWIGLDAVNQLINEKLIEDTPRIHTGRIASGPIVGAVERFVKWLKKNRDRNFLALEMESAGVLNAAHKRSISSLIIRGISDYSDERKTKLDEIGKGALRRYAMNNSLRFLWTLLDLDLIPHKN